MLGWKRRRSNKQLSARIVPTNTGLQSICIQAFHNIIELVTPHTDTPHTQTRANLQKGKKNALPRSRGFLFDLQNTTQDARSLLPPR